MTHEYNYGTTSLNFKLQNAYLNSYLYVHLKMFDCFEAYIRTVTI